MYAKAALSGCCQTELGSSYLLRLESIIKLHQLINVWILCLYVCLLLQEASLILESPKLSFHIYHHQGKVRVK